MRATENQEFLFHLQQTPNIILYFPDVSTLVSKMLDLFGHVKGFIKLDKICIDNNVFRLHYKVRGEANTPRTQ